MMGEGGQAEGYRNSMAPRPGTSSGTVNLHWIRATYKPMRIQYHANSGHLSTECLESPEV